MRVFLAGRGIIAGSQHQENFVNHAQMLFELFFVTTLFTRTLVLPAGPYLRQQEPGCARPCPHEESSQAEGRFTKKWTDRGSFPLAFYKGTFQNQVFV